MTDASTWHGITDDSTAQWALTKLAGYTAELQRLRRNAQAEIDRIQAKAADDERPVQDKIDHWQNELTGYFRRLRENDPKLKTYKLPGGNLTHRVGSKRTTVVDEPAFVEWALENAPAALAYKPQVSVLNVAHGFVRTDDGTIVSTDGVVVPGVREERGEDRWGVDLSTGGEA